MLVSIVATGNHWFLDAVLGALVAGVGMWIATRIERHNGGLRAILARPSLRRGRAGTPPAGSPS